ncbi:FAD-binding oxidoreductase [Streptomyces sp. NPDC004284]|uniref:FAD-binding oxidoreductase n=1 Tax=Streptomyces sp. NPDC004284 TaxID=3364695 RepID=UPI00367609F4
MPSLNGPVLTLGSQRYDAECATSDLSAGLEPAVVVGAVDDRDARAAVGFADRHGLPVAAKATAHQVVSPARGELLITTTRTRGVSVEAERRTARVEAGVRWRELLPHLTEAGLAALVGSAPDVGAVGYTPGGGQSPLLGRTPGYAADHVRRLSVVTADGELRRVTADAEPDLYWSLLGGKGDFGVVTEIEFDLFPVTRFYGGGLCFPGERLAEAEALEAWRTWLPTAGEDMTSSVGIQRLPDVPVLPEPLRGAFVVYLRIGYLGTAEDGERLIAPLRAAAPVLVDLVGEKPFAAIGGIHLDPVDPMPYHDRSVCLGEFTEKTARALVEPTGPDSGSALANVEIRALGGAFDREPATGNAVSTPGVLVVLFGFRVGGSDRAGLLPGQLADVVDGLAPWAADRGMANFLSPDEATDEHGMRNVYGPQRYARLAEVKRRYDPANLFRSNHNVKPA